jgi:hypothetical protein
VLTWRYEEVYVETTITVEAKEVITRVLEKQQKQKRLEKLASQASLYMPNRQASL